MRDHEGQDHYEPGELFVYANGDRWELGMVKRPAEDGSGYFCWYSRGDTAALTPTSCMHKLANAGFTHVEELLESAEKVKAENAKLREERDEFKALSELKDTQFNNVLSSVEMIKADNAKLRDFAKSYLAAVDLDCDFCPYCDPDLCDTETDPMREGCRLWEDMRKLGVEVEE